MILEDESGQAEEPLTRVIESQRRDNGLILNGEKKKLRLNPEKCQIVEIISRVCGWGNNDINMRVDQD